MPAPQAVLEQERRANDLYAQRYGNPQGDGSAAPQAPAPTDDDLTAAPAADSPSPAPIDPGLQTGHEQPEQEHGALVAQFTGLQQQFRTLQGKYRSEVPRLHDDVRSLKRDLQAARELAQQPATPGSGDQTDPMEYIADQFGKESATAFQRMLDERDARARQQAEAERTQRQSQTDEERKAQFMATIQAQHPDFLAVNNDPAFDRWLLDSQDVTGQSNKYAINQAAQQLDHATVIEIVNQFKARTGRVAPDNRGPEDQVTPKNPQPPRVPPEKKRYTTRDYQALQREKQDGLWVGRDAQYQALDKEMYDSIMSQMQQQ